MIPKHYMDAAGGDAELAELMQRFDASGDFLELYQRAEPWRVGEDAARRAVEQHQLSAHGFARSDSDGAAVHAPGGMGRSATGANAEWSTQNRESLVRKLSGFISVDVLNAMSDENLAALEAELQAKAANAVAMGGNTPGNGSIGGD